MLNWLKTLRARWRRETHGPGTTSAAHGDRVSAAGSRAHGQSRLERSSVEKREPLLVRGRLWVDTSESRWENPQEEEDLPEPGVQDFAEHLVHAHKREVRCYAADRLGELGTTAIPAIPALLNAAVDVDEVVRQSALNALHAVDPAWPKNPEAQKALPCLVDGLKSGLTEVRGVASRLLRQIGEPAVPYLAHTLSDGEDTIGQIHVIRVLARIDPTAASAIPGLTRALSSQFLHVRIAAAKSLAQLGSPPDTAIPNLVAGLSERSADARQAMAACLARAGAAAEPAIPALLPLLADRNGQVRDAAADALAQIGRPAVPALLELVRTRDAQRLKAWADSLERFWPSYTTRREDLVFVDSWESWKNLWWTAYDCLEEQRSLEAAQRAALGVLGKLGADASEAVPALIQSMADPNPAIQVAAIQGLGQVGSEARQAISQLVQLLVHENQSFREAAAEALQGIDPNWTQDPAVPGVVGAYVVRLSGTGAVGEVAVDMLAVIGPVAVPALIDALGYGNRVARENAAKALGRMGAAAQVAIPALTDALKDSHPWVREEAARALANIEGQPASALPEPGAGEPKGQGATADEDP